MNKMENKYKKLTANKVHEVFPTIVKYIDMEAEKQNLGIRYCRHKLGYEKSTMKVSLTIRGDFEEMVGPFSSAWIQIGGELKTGRAPRSGMERALQTFPDNLEYEE